MQSYFPLILLGLLAVMLFVLPARQRKRMQAKAQEMQNSLAPGTPVMTTSGLHGTVARLGDSTVDIEIAPGVVATFARQAVLEVRRPAAGAAGDARDEDTEGGAPGTAGGRPADGTL